MRVGIDMGGMSIKFGLVNDNNEIIAKKVIPTRLDVPARDLVQDMADTVVALLKENNITLDACQGVGIGSPGTVDDEKGVILCSNNFGWENVPIIPIMSETLKDTVMHIANDADVAALGEVCAGAAADVKNAVLLTLGTGVGGGVILNKEIFQGVYAGGCELGHMVIVQGGEPCTCGRRGCLESYASATALLRMARKEAAAHPDSKMNVMCDGDLTNMNGRIPFDAAAQVDIPAQNVIEEYESYLACGITNVINIFRPEKVILGGGVAAQKENLTRPLQKMVDQMCFGREHGEIAEIVVSELGNDAGIIGAANLIA
jgi:glucokinase